MIFLFLVDFLPLVLNFINSLKKKSTKKEKKNHLSFATLRTIGIVTMSQFHNISESRKSMSSSVVKLRPEYLYQWTSVV